MRVVAIEQAAAKCGQEKGAERSFAQWPGPIIYYGHLAVNLSPVFNVASIFYKEEKMTNCASDDWHGLCILQVQRRRSVKIPVKRRSLDSNVKCDGGHFRRAIESRVDADCSYPSSRINLSASNAIQTHVVDFAHGWKDEGTHARKSDLSSVTVA
jgi:hypothetical protein